jgi:peptidoglycan/xylan/chitin deacetylase (PgdA/CDA1 family)|tara:strand:+ start:1384 stop:2325 length:942 start_codon:yes stop_codon:yes gene_type:complete
MTSCKIIVYHYVRPIKNSKYPIKGMEIEDFEKQIKFLKKTYNPISVNDVVDTLNNKQEISDNSILLTFDDGLKDHYDYVYPILKENDIKGIFFPPGKPIVEKMVLDVHKIHFILASITDVNLIIDEINEYLEKLKDDAAIETFDFYYKKFAIANRFDPKEIIFIKKLLQKGLPLEFRKDLTNKLFTKYVTDNEQDFSKNLYLSMNDIYKMKKDGMVFGSHGYSHYWMDTLDEHELIEEFSRNEEFLSQISGDNLLMCYPHGSYNSLVIKKLEENNFQFALTTEVGDAKLDGESRFTLKRFDCNDFPPICSRIG